MNNLINKSIEQLLYLISNIEFDLTYVSLSISISSLLLAWRTLTLTKKSFESAEKSYEVTSESLKLTDESLRLAKEMYILSSKDFEPKIKFEIKENSIKLVNHNNDLFSIEHIDIIGIHQVGFEYYEKPSVVLIPLVDISKSIYILDGMRENKEFHFKFDEVYPLSAVHPLSEEKKYFINKKIEADFGIDNDNKIGYATPSLQTYYYLIEIGYSNKFNDYKRLLFKQIHLHGIGEFKKIRIKDDEFQSMINQCYIPKDLDNNRLWEYVIVKYEQKW